MIAFDTNVILRYLLRDDPKQARKVRALVDGLDRDGERAYIADIVLCELVWVLTRAFRFDRGQIAEVLRSLLATRQLRFASTDRFQRAIRALEAGKGDFADYMIREQATDAGCDSVKTFDKAVLGDEMFSSP